MTAVRVGWLGAPVGNSRKAVAAWLLASGSATDGDARAFEALSRHTSAAAPKDDDKHDLIEQRASRRIFSERRVGFEERFGRKPIKDV